MIREMKKTIKADIDTIIECADGFYPDMEFPYCVMSLGNEYYYDGRSQYNLDVQVFDNNESKKYLDETIEKIKEKLHRRIYYSTGKSYVVYFLSSGYVTTSDNQIKQKVCTFTVYARKDF